MEHEGAMTTILNWPFLMVDPPEGGEAMVNEALAANSFPWHRIESYVEADTDHGIIVRWTPLDGGAQARFNQYGNEILIDLWSWQNSLDITKYAFTHESGHLLDYAYLNNMKRRDLMALMLADPSHAPLGHPSYETWRTGQDVSYWNRIFEAWADVFVATYAPTLIYPLYPNGSRYSHRCNNASAVKAIMDRSDTVTVEQWAGASRWETAQVASMNRYPQMPTPVVVVIAADGTPDAQVAAAVAGQPGWTLLLVQNATDAVPANTLAEVTRLKPPRIIYVGGTAAIKPAARTAIEAAAQP